MRRKLTIAVEEQLEVDKLIEAEELAKKNSEVDVLYTANELEEANKPEETPEEDFGATDETAEEPTETPSTDEDTEGSEAETPSEESSEETQTEETPKEEDKATDDTEASTEEEKEPVEEPKETKEPEEVKDEETDATSVAAESFRSIEFEELALEANGFISSLSSSVKVVLASLGTMGLNFGSSIINKVYKGVLYTMGKIASISRNGLRTLVFFSDHWSYALDKQKEDISGLRDVIEQVKSKTIEESDNGQGIKPQFTKERVINVLKIGDNVDFNANVSVLNIFIESVIKYISAKVEQDISAIKHIIAYADSGTTSVPMKLLVNPSISADFISGPLEGYSETNELLQTSHYKETLPGDIAFIMHLPSPELTSLDDFRQACFSSKMFLGFNTQNFKNIDSIDYMTLDELSAFLDSLEQLTDTCIAHKTYYENILKIKQNLKISYKNYFTNLIGSKDKVTAKDSLIEYVYIKSVFVDKVYITAMLAIHNYALKVITNGITLAKETVKEYS